MNAENQDQEFEKLQRLLKLKRYEQPPPRYFNNFSGTVISRIKSGSGRMDSFEDVVAQSPWLQRLWAAVEGRPAISGIVAATICGLMIAGVFMAENVTTQPIAKLPLTDGTESANTFLAGNPLAVGSFAGAPALVSSTNVSSLSTRPNLFEGLPNIQPMQVNYR